jgi:hypothetical protein
MHEFPAERVKGEDGQVREPFDLSTTVYVQEIGTVLAESVAV